MSGEDQLDHLDISMRRKVNGGFAGALLILIVIGWVSVESVRHVIADARWAAQANSTLTLIEGVAGSLARAESASRGYSATGETNFLESFEEEIDTGRRKIEQLRETMKGSPNETELFEDFKLNADEKITWMTTAAEVRKTRGLAGVRDLGGSGAALMVAVTLSMDRIRIFEERQLKEREQESRAAMQKTVGVTMAGALTAVVFLGFAGVLVNREIRQSAAARADLHILNGELEQRVATRTAELHAKVGELSRSEERLHTVTESLREGLVISNLEGRIIHWNRAGLEMHGYQSLAEGLLHLSEISGTFELSSFSGGVLPLEQWPLPRMLAGEQLRDFQVKVRRLDRDWQRVFSYSGGKVQSASGEMLVYLAIEDITLRKHAEEQIHRLNANLERRVAERTAELAVAKERAESADRLKSEFLATMSHELRTPLNGIIGFSEFLIDGTPGELNDKQREYLVDVLDSGQHLLDLINDILDLSKVEAGMMELHSETFSIRRAFDEVGAIITPLVRKKDLAIDFQIDSGLDAVTLDRQKFKQVCYNLISNAVKFSHDGGGVRVAASREDDGALRLRVEDDGIGIRSEDLGKLFVEFQQLDSGLARQHQGTGLGLALTKKLVEFQSGSVSVASEFGRGSTFTVVFPGQCGKDVRL